MPDREARDDSYDYLTRVPERGAREHEIQRQDERYIEAVAQPIIFPLSNEYSPVYILVTLRVTLIVAMLYSYLFTCGRYSPPRQYIHSTFTCYYREHTLRHRMVITRAMSCNQPSTPRDAPPHLAENSGETTDRVPGAIDTKVPSTLEPNNNMTSPVISQGESQSPGRPIDQPTRRPARSQDSVSKINDLEDEVADLRARLRSQSQYQLPNQVHDVKNLGNKPEEFNGDRSKVYSFLTQIRMYTSLQPRTFHDDLQKVLFAASYLRGTAFNWWEPYFNKPRQEQPLWIHDFSEFARKLEETFGDPNRAKTAANRITSLKQTKSASEYWAEFQQYAVQTDWNDSAQCYAFRQGLKPAVKDALALIDEPTECNELAEVAIRLDGRIYEREKESRRTTGEERRADPPPASRTNPSSFRKSSVRPAENTKDVRASTPKARPATTAPTLKRRGKLTAEEGQ